MAKPTKYIVVTGGVLSGLGKGITAASLANVLKSRGLRVNIQKCDPYLNTDAGTLNPAEHGEVFVTADGAETDLDLGHYERFLDAELTRSSSLISGQVYAKVIADERAGKYLGKTIQIIPHVTGEVQRQIINAGAGYDVHIVEIGGTVGDIESLAFIEAVRQLRHQVGPDNLLNVHVVYVPYLEASHELKTKPAQNTVRDLREAGLQPDVIVARAEQEVPQSIIDKLSLFCDVDPQAIVALPTAETVYEVPLILAASGLDSYICRRLKLRAGRSRLAPWRTLVTQIKNERRPKVTIGVVAKYMENADTYMSVFEALRAAAWQRGVWVEIKRIAAEDLEGSPRPGDLLAGLDGILVPGGFGRRGVEGKIIAADYAIDHKLPYLGLCLGMQIGVITIARRAGLEGANSTEMDPDTAHPVIALMADQEKVSDKGGTMRLGNYPCQLKAGSRSAAAYGQRQIDERHRHRYEFNNSYREQLQEAGIILAGLSPDDRLVEIIELANHPFFVGTQFHPEFKSRPQRPHPLFVAFMNAVTQQAGIAKPRTRSRRALAAVTK